MMLRAPKQESLLNRPQNEAGKQLDSSIESSSGEREISCTQKKKKKKTKNNWREREIER
jgi:hypothetical protein